MKTKRSLLVIALIGLLALIAAGYCFWLMTVPLSYDLIYVVLGGFIVSVGVFLVALISSIVITVRLRRSQHASSSPEITPSV